MGPIAAAWHLLNLFAPALGIGVIAATLTKLIWRRDLVQAGWLRLVAAAVAAASATTVVGLLAFGRDGKTATYAAMVVACALALFAAGRTARPAPRQKH